MAADPLRALANGWRILHLSAAVPDRVPGWDVIVLTAASPQQAALYRHRLARLRRLGRVAASTRLEVVADPAGKRIGSGGATLNVLRALAISASMRVLVVHAGGDSKRLPWASVIGKAFVPVPLLSDPDQGCPSLFEHCLAACASLPGRLPAGGLVCMSGDVLPLVEHDALRPSHDGVTVMAAPTPLATAVRHGVVVAASDGTVRDLLQKPGLAELHAAGGVLAGGTALIDTGIWCFAGTAFAALCACAHATEDPVAAVLADGRELSLYEEISAAWLPQRHAWLAGRPLGQTLARLVGGGSALTACVCPDLRFLHFGTGSEVADHLARDWDGLIARRLLAEAGPSADPEATILHARLDPATAVGAGSLVLSSVLGPAVRIGRRCVVVGTQALHEPFRLPDHCCMWQVAVHGGGWVTALAGVDDNPKDSWPGGRFLNQDAAQWMAAHGISAADLWGDAPAAARTGWNARLFPVQPGHAGLAAAAWMLGAGGDGAGASAWRGGRRLSLAELGAQLDADRQSDDDDGIAAQLLVARLNQVVDGSVDGHATDLARQLPPQLRGIVDTLADQARTAHASAYRRQRLGGDLLDAVGRDPAAGYQAAWDAVSTAVADALPQAIADPVSGLSPAARAEAALPVRIDLAGGWSDTPPYCLEHPARVLNLAIALDGQRPIGCAVSAVATATCELRLHNGAWVSLDAAAAMAPADVTDPTVLPRLALQVCGYVGADGIRQGVRLEAWSRIPKGSGLGGSSILAAAIVQALQRLAGRPDDPTTVMRLVLVLEQRLSSGGGWQDQLGGLVPGAKLLSSLPVRPLEVAIESIPLDAQAQAALHRRIVVVYTGIDRLARDVLQRVMGRYLSCDRTVMRSIGRLASLAGDAQRLLASGDLDGLGDLVAEVWSLHQQLDPLCSNPAVDELFARISSHARGWKLAGAGGGGFAIIVARSDDSAEAIRAQLRGVGKVLIPGWALA